MSWKDAPIYRCICGKNHRHGSIEFLRCLRFRDYMRVWKSVWIELCAQITCDKICHY